MAIGSIDGLDSWRTDKTIGAACPYPRPWNVLGWPAINVPHPTGHIGAQLLGPADSQPRLLAVADRSQHGLVAALFGPTAPC